MLTSSSIACPYETCEWHGNLVPSLLQGGMDYEIASMQKAWFQCPDCQRDWEVQITDDEVTVSPVVDDRKSISSLSATPHPLPKSEQTGDVKVFTFTAGRARDVENVIATELAGMDDSEGKCHLLLDFTNVEYIGSAELGTLIGLHKRMKASGGRLTLFNLNLNVFEVFAITRLDNLLEICR